MVHADLRAVSVAWRGADVPKTFDVECKDCARTTMLHLTRDGVLFVSDEDAVTLRCAQRAYEREQLANRFDK
jgi:hypothetical protein